MTKNRFWPTLRTKGNLKISSALLPGPNVLSICGSFIAQPICCRDVPNVDARAHGAYVFPAAALPNAGYASSNTTASIKIEYWLLRGWQHQDPASI